MRCPDCEGGVFVFRSYTTYLHASWISFSFHKYLVLPCRAQGDSVFIHSPASRILLVAHDLKPFITDSGDFDAVTTTWTCSIRTFIAWRYHLLYAATSLIVRLINIRWDFLKASAFAKALGKFTYQWFPFGRDISCIVVGYPLHYSSVYYMDIHII